jgi:thymidine phosphorylase
MLTSAALESNLDKARESVREALDSGAALECFRQNVEAQGGDPRICDEPARLLDRGLHEERIVAPRDGFVIKVDATEIGNAVAAIGGGRARITDKIDPAVGFLFEIKLGDEVKAGDALGLLYCRDEAQAVSASSRIGAAYTIAAEPPHEAYQLIKEVITS